MKKIVLTLAFIALTLSCSDDITGLNVDTKNPTTTKPEYLYSNAQKALVDQMVSTSVNLNVFRLFAQQWTETTYPDESQYDITTRVVPDNHFRTLYRNVLKDLQESRKLLDTEVAVGASQIAVLNNKKAMVDILMAYSYSVLVDTFGNVPYSEALDIIAHPLPKYDDAQTIYKDLITRLTADSGMLTDSEASFGTADLIYGGDIGKWKKFANSLKLRLAINMADVDFAYASAQVLSAKAAGIFTSSADNANLKYLPLQPNANPLYADLVVSGRNDFVPANTIVNKMNSLNDPRRATYFTLKGGVYVGGIYGSSNGYANFSHIGTTYSNPEFPGTILDYTEISFLLAEASARGIAVGGTTASLYNAAIDASMQSAGVDAVSRATYMAQPAVAYATAAGTWQQKIGEQAWLALYNRGFEAWTSYRRLDYPVLVAPATAYNGLTAVPKRYSYPSIEQTLNATSVNAAITAIGGNTLLGKLFWDKF